ncbi:hypothetical protein [Filimonas effusa]|uniref:Uncharacterized protein n=1 Tax=Filimonas effusa TaxID=2508721 RepID=A0A4Q1DAS0_9BACT|nr:hypothetical protein [Filimonas effusa]RXK85865.1 hypothetical protein ESB13_03380 [Filimonas effusa]
MDGGGEGINDEDHQKRENGLQITGGREMEKWFMMEGARDVSGPETALKRLIDGYIKRTFSWMQDCEFMGRYGITAGRLCNDERPIVKGSVKSGGRICGKRWRYYRESRVFSSLA